MVQALQGWGTESSTLMAFQRLQESYSMDRTKTNRTETTYNGSPSQSRSAGTINLELNFSMEQYLSGMYSEEQGQRYNDVKSSIYKKFEASIGIDISYVSLFDSGTKKAADISEKILNTFFNMVEDLVSKKDDGIKGFLKGINDLFDQLGTLFGSNQNGLDSVTGTIEDMFNSLQKEMNGTQAQHPPVRPPIPEPGEKKPGNREIPPEPLNDWRSIAKSLQDSIPSESLQKLIDQSLETFADMISSRKKQPAAQVM